MGWWESGRINTVLAADVGTHHSVEIKADQDLDRTLDQLGVLPDRQEEEEGGGGGGGGGGEGAVVDGLDSSPDRNVKYEENSQNQISKRGRRCRPKRRNKYGMWQNFKLTLRID